VHVIARSLLIALLTHVRHETGEEWRPSTSGSIPLDGIGPSCGALCLRCDFCCGRCCAVDCELCIAIVLVVHLCFATV
jgi:hypothetical protein